MQQAIPTVELRPEKIEDLNKQPQLSTRMFLSEDGKWFVHETITRDFKPMTYMAQVFKKDEKEDDWSSF